MKQWIVKRMQVPVGFQTPAGQIQAILRPGAPFTLDKFGVPVPYVDFAEQSQDFQAAIRRGEVQEYIPQPPMAVVAKPPAPAPAPVVAPTPSPPAPVPAPVVAPPQPTVSEPLLEAEERRVSTPQHIEAEQRFEQLNQVEAAPAPAPAPAPAVEASPAVEDGLPAGQPNSSWTLPQLLLYTNRHGITVPPGVNNRPGILRAIAAHSVKP